MKQDTKISVKENVLQVKTTCDFGENGIPLDDFESTMKEIKNQHHLQFSKREGKIGRNEPCPCGSGKKFKKCCLLKIQLGGFATMIKLMEIDSSALPEEVIEIAPVECMSCGYDDHIPKKFFKVTPEIKNEKGYNELCSVVKKELGFESFTECSCETGYIISVCRCPKCGSEEIFEDL